MCIGEFLVPGGTFIKNVLIIYLGRSLLMEVEAAGAAPGRIPSVHGIIVGSHNALK
jgi:hypothetical protein